MKFTVSLKSFYENLSDLLFENSDFRENLLKYKYQLLSDQEKDKNQRALFDETLSFYVEPVQKYFNQYWSKQMNA